MIKHNLLLAAPPEEVAFGDRKYPINADYRVFIRFEMIVQDSSVSDNDRLIQPLSEFYRGDIPDDIETAANEMLQVYTRGMMTNRVESNSGAHDGDKMIYSYEHDSDMIYAAFVQCYGIDLTDVNMHWWKFRALFDNLPQDCEIMRAIYYRSVKIDGKLLPEEQKRLKRLKKFYALPDNRTAEEKERDFANDFAALF